MKTLVLTAASTLLLAACAGPPAPDLPPPTRSGQTVALAQEALFTVNPEDDTLVVLPVDGGAPVRHPVGRRPSRVVATADRLFVSLRGARAVAVLALEGRSLREVGRVAVGHEPMGLALSSDGARLYVASSLSDRIDVIDTARLDVVAEWPVPGQPRGLALHPSGRHLYVTTLLMGAVAVDTTTGEAQPVPLGEVRGGDQRVVRASGDPAVSPDGAWLVIPAIDVDLTLPQGDVYYGPHALQPFVSEVGLDPADGTPATGQPNVIVLSSRAVASSLAFSPAGEVFFVSAADNGELLAYISPSARRADVESGAAFSLTATPLGVMGTSGVVFDDAGNVFLARSIDRGVARIALTAAAPLPSPLVDAPGVPSTEVGAWQTGLSGELERGRRLFHDVSNRAMTDGNAVCSTCHIDGRTDGITWSLGDGPRQTRTLAEGVSGHTPLGWVADRPSVAAGARKTVERMGGRGIDDNDAHAIQAFVAALDRPDIPGRDETSAQITRGGEVFAALGCAGCHAGEDYTDRTLHALSGRPEMSTPSLKGIAITAPYLVDGSVASLEALLDLAPALGKGATSSLGADDRAALLAFLRSR